VLVAKLVANIATKCEPRWHGFAQVTGFELIKKIERIPNRTKLHSCPDHQSP
jgi:hypothetical protein